MANYKTKGVILKRTNLGEADRIITIFSDNYGKIRAIAKGIRKQKSKIAGNLEPFCLVKLYIAEGRNLDIVAEAEIEEAYFDLRNNLELTNIAYYIAEVVEKMCGDKENHPEVFELIKKVLGKIKDIQKELIIPYFELNFLSAIGYHPELYKCTHCPGDISPEKINFDFTGGGLSCDGCGKGFKVSSEAVKLLRLFLERDIDVLTKLKISPKVATEAKKLVEAYITHIHQQEFKSRRFVR